MIEKQVIIDKIEVLESGHIQVRQATKILEDGIEISKTYQRWILEQNSDLTGQDERVQLIARAAWKS